jgi:hypothetical protein
MAPFSQIVEPPQNPGRFNSDGKAISWREYERLATRLYYDAGDRGWWPAANALYNRMRVGDLVWSRDWQGLYYLGRVSGEWEYSEKSDHKDADIVNFRRCEWYCIGVADRVPGAVRNSFSRGRVLQAVNDQSSLKYSERIFAKVSGRKEYGPLKEEDANESSDLFSLISPFALEDLVGLYLQSLGYSIVPTSCQRTSATYEFVLRHRECGEMAAVQVKSGSQVLNRDDYSGFPGTMYLFAASEQYAGGHHPSVKTISRADLIKFISHNKRILPETITVWL